MILRSAIIPPDEMFKRVCTLISTKGQAKMLQCRGSMPLRPSFCPAISDGCLVDHHLHSQT